MFSARNAIRAIAGGQRDSPIGLSETLSTVGRTVAASTGAVTTAMLASGPVASFTQSGGCAGDDRALDCHRILMSMSFEVTSGVGAVISIVVLSLLFFAWLIALFALLVDSISVGA